MHRLLASSPLIPSASDLPGGNCIPTVHFSHPPHFPVVPSGLHMQPFTTGSSSYLQVGQQFAYPQTSIAQNLSSSGSKGLPGVSGVSVPGISAVAFQAHPGVINSVNPANPGVNSFNSANSVNHTILGNPGNPGNPSNPGNPALVNSGISNPGVSNPDLADPGITNSGYANQGFANQGPTNQGPSSNTNLSTSRPASHAASVVSSTSHRVPVSPNDTSQASQIPSTTQHHQPPVQGDQESLGVPVGVSASQKALSNFQTLNDPYSQNLPLFSSQAYSQYPSLAQPQIQAVQQRLFYPQPDLPTQQTQDRMSPQAPVLPPQAQPPHALLPRMLTAQPMLHPFPTNDYYAAPSGFQQASSNLQQQELHYYIQPPMIPYYQQPVSSNGPSNAMGNVNVGLGANGALAGVVHSQYVSLLLIPNSNNVLQNSVASTANAAMYQAGTNPWSTPALSVLTLQLQPTQQPPQLQSAPLTLQQSYLGPLEYPMSGQIASIPSGLQSHQTLLQSGILMMQPLYNTSPSLLKMNSLPYGPNSQKMGGIGNVGVGGTLGMDQIDGNGNRTPYGNTGGGTHPLAGNMPGTMAVDASLQMPRMPGAKKNQCPVCLKVFKRPSSLQIHFYIHTGVKLYKCEWEGCGRLFNVKSNMARHYKLHLKNDMKNDKG